MHVHHGLSTQADAWLDHCAAQCRRWSRGPADLVFAATRLVSLPQAGESVEAWARRARYRALRALAIEGGADLVLLGHHRRDQAETFLLQALRSGGVAALSAMPRSVRRDGITWARPWLDVPADAIAAQVRRHRLRWVEDDSNSDPRFARNRLRRDVWPALLAAFPDSELTLASAARRAQAAVAVVAEVVAVDLANVSREGGLAIDALQTLLPARQSHVLQAWFRTQADAAMPASLIDRLQTELDPTRTRRWPSPGGEVASYRGCLRWRRAPASASSGVSNPSAMRVDLSRPGTHPIAGWSGAVRVERVTTGGIDVELAADLLMRPRAAGDRFQAGAGRPPRSLKLQFQAAAVAEPDRHGPVACSDGRIAFVAGLGIDARVGAAPGRPQVSLTWLPAADASGRLDTAG